MPLITRIARLFHADMNAVLDKIEEPELLLKQAIRDMQETLDHDKRQIKLQEYELKQLISRLTKKETELTSSFEGINSFEEQLRVCFKSEKDDLARSLIKRKLEAEQTIAILSKKKTEQTESLDQLKENYKEQHTQLKNMRQKAEILTTDDIDTPYSDLGTKGTKHSPTNSIQYDEIEIAFLHEKAKWSAS